MNPVRTKLEIALTDCKKDIHQFIKFRTDLFTEKFGRKPEIYFSTDCINELGKVDFCDIIYTVWSNCRAKE